MEAIYHYTSLSTLALILKYRKIRFNTLMQVDDMEEGTVQDFEAFGRFCFASCWTKDSDESIALWNLYTPDMTGVRIKFLRQPFSLFSEEEYDVFNFENGFEGIETCAELEDIKRNNNYSTSFEFIDVEYTDDEQKIFPKIINIDKGITSIDPTGVGKYKKSHWMFQKESRFLIKVFPYSINNVAMQPGINLETENINPLMRIKDSFEQKNLDFTYIDLMIAPEALKRMEILCGPKMSESDKIIVKALVDSYNPGIQIIHSPLKIRNKIK